MSHNAYSNRSLVGVHVSDHIASRLQRNIAITAKAAHGSPWHGADCRTLTRVGPETLQGELCTESTLVLPSQQAPAQQIAISLGSLMKPIAAHMHAHAHDPRASGHSSTAR